MDVYQIWAEMLLFGENRSFPAWQFQRYVTHIGRSEQVCYRRDAAEIRHAIGDKLLIERVPPKSIAGGMGAQVFILWSLTVEELEHQARFVLERNDGTNWL